MTDDKEPEDRPTPTIPVLVDASLMMEVTRKISVPSARSDFRALEAKGEANTVVPPARIFGVEAKADAGGAALPSETATARVLNPSIGPGARITPPYLVAAGTPLPLRAEGNLTAEARILPAENPIEGSGATRVGISGHATGIVVPPNWEEERAAWQRKVEAIDAALAVLKPIVNQLEKAEVARHGMGGNYPPTRIEDAPISAEDLNITVAAVAALRAQLDQNYPTSWEAVRLAGLAFNKAATGVAGFVKYVGDRGDTFFDAFVKSIGDQLGKKVVSTAQLSLILTQLHVDLGSLWSLIEHVLRVLDKLN
jgi:hypothetical protein